MKNLFSRLALAAAAATLLVASQSVFAQGTAFTYQGQLNANGSPANGLYDFRFKLNSDPLGDFPVTGFVFTNAIPVSNGLFTTTIDFGRPLFTGSNFWLDVAVRTNNPANTLSYTALSPLQPLTPTPYALFANAASNLLGVLPAAQLSGALGSAGLAGTYNGAVTLNNSANNFSGSYTGNGANVTNVNAAALSGLNAASFWQLGGNNVAAGQYLGSTNGNPVEIWVGGARALRLESAAGVGANVIGGYSNNYVSPGNYSATIAGGGIPGGTNRVLTGGGTVSGGYNNTASNFVAVVSGGANNGATGNASGVGGGSENAALGDHDSIQGGQGNLANGGHANIGGGSENSALGDHANIAGGSFNVNSGYVSSIGGGDQNLIQALADHSTIVGGGDNMIVGSANFPVYASIGGGQYNQILTNAIYTVIGGGSQNTNAGSYAAINGGNLNNIYVDHGVIGGGQNNIIQTNADHAFIGGGWYNAIGLNNYEGTIAGGYVNVISNFAGYSTIGGGTGNVIQSNSIYSTIGGGYANTASGKGATVPGGQGNLASGDFSVAGGYYNLATNSGSVVAGGGNNRAGGFNASIGGGAANDAAGQGSAVGGGYFNTNSGDYATIAGGQNNIATAQYAVIGGGFSNTNAGYEGTIAGGQQNFAGNFFQPTVGGGYFNIVSNQYATIGGGFNNTNTGSAATIPGGSQNLATGASSFAAGANAHATNDGAFVWADAEGTPFSSTITNQFSVRANGGVVFATSGAGMTVDGQTVFAGKNGNGLTNLNAAQLTGSATLSGLTVNGTLNLPANVTVNAGGGKYLYSDGVGNFFLGVGAGNPGTVSGNDNVGYGENTLAADTSGANNTAVGSESLVFNTTGSGNTGVGFDAMLRTTIGHNNTAVGNLALSNNTNGSDNTAIGDSALAQSKNGSLNIALGASAGFNIGAGGSNIDIGNLGLATDTNVIRLGSGQTATYVAGTINGDGGGLTNLNAVTLNGLHSTNYWQTGGNSGTSPGANYLGTSDDQALELHVNGTRAFRLEPTATVPNVIGGYSGNLVDNGAQGATIGGGGTSGFVNRVGGTLGTIAGGSGNVIGTNANDATLIGGRQNTIDTNSWGAFIGGGHGNWIQPSANSGGFLGNSSYSTISGGYGNLVQTNAVSGTIGGGGNNAIGTNAQFATVGGGESNTNSGNYATIPGGFQNIASGANSFAAGTSAQATNTGSFVWGDDSGTATKSFTNNQFMARAANGVVLLTSTAASPTSYATGTAGVALLPNATAWTTVSDRNAKKNFQPVDAEGVLDKLAAIPIQQWNYKWENDGDVPNIGPMAQDFKQAFYPGRDDKGISTLEFDGVELAAIQGLNHKLENEAKAKDSEIQDLKKRLEKLERLMAEKNVEAK